MNGTLQVTPKPFDAIVVCGMGPVPLSPDIPETKVTTNVMNFFNAISAKLLVTHGMTDEAILSGYKSEKGPQPEPVQQMEKVTSEADILKSYPTLHAEDLVHAWAYEQSHRDEIDREIAENEKA